MYHVIKSLAFLLLGAATSVSAAEDLGAGEGGPAAHLPAGLNTSGTLRVAAEYDADEIRIHFEYATENPSWYHQY